MREVKQVDPTAVWYTPKIDDNRKDPEPFRVLLRPMTGRDKNQADHAMMTDAIREGSMNGEGLERQIQRLSERLVEQCVDRVEGYRVTKRDGTVVTPTNGAELVDLIMTCAPNEVDVLDDIYAALTNQSRLAEGLAGNSSGRSCSSVPPTTRAAAPTSGHADGGETGATVGMPTIKSRISEKLNEPPGVAKAS